MRPYRAPVVTSVLSVDCLNTSAATPSAPRLPCSFPPAQRFAHETRERHRRRRNAVVVRITPNDKNNPPGKLADAEVHFTEGVLEGMKLIGFAVWERRTGGGRNVTFPARQYSVNGERRTFSLLRPANGDATKQNRIRELVLQAYSEFEQGIADES